MLLGTNVQPVVLNLINYMRTSDNIVIPGCFNFTGETDFTARTRLVIRIEYRGAKIPDSTGLKKLAGKVRTAELARPKIEMTEIKLEKERKEDEKEEESNSEYDGDSEFIDDLKNEQQ